MKVHLELRRCRPHTVLVDDVDMSRHVLTSGFHLELEDPDEPRLHLVLVPDEITVDGDVKVLAQRLVDDTDMTDDDFAYRHEPLTGSG